MIQTSFFDEEKIFIDSNGLKPVKLEDVEPDKDIVLNRYIIYPSGGYHPFYGVPNTFKRYQEKIWPYFTSGSSFGIKMLRPDFGKTERYPRLNFQTTTNSWDTSIHILIAKAWIPNPNNKPYVCHNNDNTTDFLVNNLTWGTASENNKGKIKKRKDTMEDKYLSFLNKGVIQS